MGYFDKMTGQAGLLVNGRLYGVAHTVSHLYSLRQLQAIDKRRLLRSAGKIAPAQLDQIVDMIDLLLGRRA